MVTHRAIPARPHLDQYRKQAKELLQDLVSHAPDALRRVGEHHPRLKELTASSLASTRVRLADTQLVIAREHGFDSWPKFAAHLRTSQLTPPDAFEEGIRVGAVQLDVEIGGLHNARALVLFVLAGNVSRHHAGIREICAAFQRASICTVLADLMSEDEDVEDAIHEQLRYDIPRLADRMTAIVDRFTRDALFGKFRVGLFGSGTGAAVAVTAARLRSAAIHALVCSAGRPDLAGSALGYIGAPSLFICGGEDAVGLGFMRTLLAVPPPQLPRRLEVIDGAGERFDAGPHAARAAVLAQQWFDKYLSGGADQVEARR